MTTSSPLPSPSEALCQRKRAPPRGSAELLAWCKCAAIVGTLTAVNAGCAAAPVRAEPGRCPQESLDTMREEFRVGEGNIAGYISLGGEPAPEEPKKMDLIAFPEGPITALIIRQNRRGYGPGLPKGTLLFGYVWTDLGFKGRTDAEYALVRFTSAKTPEGKTYPVCLVAYDEDGLAIKQAGSRPGVAVLQRFGHAMVIKTWPPPPGPHPTDSE